MLKLKNARSIITMERAFYDRSLFKTATILKPIDVRYIILNLLEMIMVFVKEMR